MYDKFRDFAKNTVGAAIGAIIWEGIRNALYPFIIFVTTFVLASKLLVSFANFLAPFKGYIMIIVGAGSAWLFLTLYQRYSRFHPTFPRFEFDFQILKNEITYEYKDKTHMIYKKKKVLKALKNNLDVYHDKYRWTGEGKVDAKSAIKGQEFRTTIRKNVWQFYEIRFQKTLKKGEEITTEVIWDLEDVAGKAVPYFSVTIEEPTNLLKLNLLLPPELGVKEVVCETSSGIWARQPFTSKIMPLDRMATWDPKPKLLYHYEMRWNF